MPTRSKLLAVEHPLGVDLYGDGQLTVVTRLNGGIHGEALADELVDLQLPQGLRRLHSPDRLLGRLKAVDMSPEEYLQKQELLLWAKHIAGIQWKRNTERAAENASSTWDHVTGKG